jgi:hypothetical protein
VFAKEPVPSIILTFDIAIYGASANRLAHAFLFDHSIAADISNRTARHHEKIQLFNCLDTRREKHKKYLDSLTKN